MVFWNSWVFDDPVDVDNLISSSSGFSKSSLNIWKFMVYVVLKPGSEIFFVPKQHIKSQKHHFANRGLSSQSYGFSSSHIWMWEMDYKEGWVLKKWCFWTVMLEKTLEHPLDSKEITPVKPKGNQSLVFIGRTNAEAEAPVLWPPDVKSQITRKDPDAGKDGRQEEEGATEGEMVGWHHQLNWHEFKQAPRGSEWQGRLVCYSPWSRKELDTT